MNIAEKVVIITEKIIAQGICDIIEASGATGYTIIEAGGKGSRNIRLSSARASVVEDFSNVKIEVIVNERQQAEVIIEKVAAAYFKHYPGITYIEKIEILRPTKF